MTIIFAVILYSSFGFFIGGLVFRIWTYWRTPSPLKIPLTPAPITTQGVVWRMGREVFLFAITLKSNQAIWLFGWLFHGALLVVLLRHLRYTTEPVWSWIVWLQPFGVYAGMLMMFALGGLWLRRIVVERMRYISSPSDHLMLALLMLITGSGLMMKYVAHTDIVAAKSFFLGLMYFDIQPMPLDIMFMLHLLLVSLLMVIFPLSKLLHAPGVFFSPTLNQVDNAREQRHIT